MRRIGATRLGIVWVVLVSVTLGYSMSAYPAGLLGIGKAAELASNDVNTDEVNANQTALIQTYTAAAQKLEMANYHLLLAFDRKSEAAAHKEVADALAAGAVLDQDALTKQQVLTENADDAVNEELEKSEELSVEAKESYAAGFSSYVVALKETNDLKDEFHSFLLDAQEVIASSPITRKIAMRKELGVGMSISTKTPGLLARLLKTAPKMVAFAQKQGIELPEDSTSVLGDL